MINKLISLFMVGILGLTSTSTIATVNRTQVDEYKIPKYEFIQLPTNETVTAKDNFAKSQNSERPLTKGTTKLISDYSNIDVLLTVGDVSSLTLTCLGTYYIEENNYVIQGSLSNPQLLNISIMNNGIKIVHNNATVFANKSCTLKNIAYQATSQIVKLNTTDFEFNDGRYYLGDIKIDNKDNKVRLINHLPTAFYLYGVVPYEMSESCNIQALMAQAIAAKTYAFSFPSNTTEYQITDSMNYQGYRGYLPNYSKCLNACLNVCGKVLTYNGNTVLSYYAATNGGETAIPSWVWGSTYQDHLFSTKLDDIDLMYYPERYIETLPIEYNVPIENKQFKTLIEDDIKNIYNLSEINIATIINAEMHTPNHNGSVRDLSLLRLTVLTDTDTEYVVDIKASKLKDVGIFTKPFKIYWGREIDNGYEVLYCRWGHGLGMSQYGAEQRAKGGASYTDILAFYYDKLDITNITESKPNFTTAPIPTPTPTNTPNPTATPKPTNTPRPTATPRPTNSPTPIPTATPTVTPRPTNTPTPTPKPTNTPTPTPIITNTPSPTFNPPNSTAEGTITVSSARMRADATTNSIHITSVRYGERVEVIGEKDGWLHCKYNQYVGYIRGDLLSVGSAIGIGWTGMAYTKVNAKMYNKPTHYGNIIRTIPKNSFLIIYGKIGKYYYVQIGNNTSNVGYVNSSDLNNFTFIQWLRFS